MVTLLFRCAEVTFVAFIAFIVGEYGRNRWARNGWHVYGWPRYGGYGGHGGHGGHRRHRRHSFLDRLSYFMDALFNGIRNFMLYLLIIWFGIIQSDPMSLRRELILFVVVGDIVVLLAVMVDVVRMQIIRRIGDRDGWSCRYTHIRIIRTHRSWVEHGIGIRVRI